MSTLDQGFPKCPVRGPRAPQKKLSGSANEEYKQEAFYLAREVLFTTAKQMYSAVFSVCTELFRSNEIDLKKHKFRERERQ